MIALTECDIGFPSPSVLPLDGSNKWITEK